MSLSEPCPEVNVEYVNSDLFINMNGFEMKMKAENVPSWSECNKWCSTLDGCKAWTYSTSQRTCTAKTNKTRRRFRQDFLSGSTECNEESIFSALETPTAVSSRHKRGFPIPGLEGFVNGAQKMLTQGIEENREKVAAEVNGKRNRMKSRKK